MHPDILNNRLNGWIVFWAGAKNIVWGRILIVVGVALLLCACSRQRSARLYPANDLAAATGVIEANYLSTGTGHTTLEAVMPDGEVLKGEASVVTESSTSFGSVVGNVYGSRGMASGSATGAGFTMAGASQGTAALYGSKGTSMLCEFYIDGMSGHGYGGCRSMKGALYRLQY